MTTMNLFEPKGSQVMNEHPRQVAVLPVCGAIAERKTGRTGYWGLVALLLFLATASSWAQSSGRQHAASARAAAAQSGVEATSVPLDAPAGVSFDSAGNVYFADQDDNIVRRVDTTGILTTVAGTGAEGFGGDGGAATSAQLDSPTAVVVDGSGNLYIADTNNNRIRKITSGTIATIAGTGASGYSGDGAAAVSATLSAPTALALDAAGNLYIADTGNNVVRKISGTTITTVAGTGREGFAGDGGQATLAYLDSPGGVAVDAAGNLYIADTGNNRIRKVTSAGVITTIAGTGTAGYGGDGGSAVAALLSAPQGLALDAVGDLFFADSGNNRIRRISSTGVISTVAGNGAQGYAGDLGSPAAATLDTPRSVAVTAAGLVSFSDTENDRVRSVSSNGNLYTTAGIAPTSAATLVLATSSPSMVYGTAAITATFSNGSHTATGSISFTEVTGTPAALGMSPLSSNQSTLALPALSVGVHQIVASYAGDSSNPAVSSGVYVLTITPVAITATVTGVSQPYGVAIPTLSGALSGVLAQDTAKVTGVFSTTATSSSAPGTYPIAAVLTGSAAGNYTLSLATNSGSFVITKASSTTTLTLSVNTQYAGVPVVLTALTASTTTGVPTGSILFSDNGTALSTVPLANGGAQLTVTTLAVGAHTLTAAYSGDANFVVSNATASSTESIAPAPDFTLNVAASASTQTVVPGSAAVFSLGLQPQGGSFSSPISLSASGLPAGATATFSPSIITPGATASNFTMTVQTPVATALLRSSKIGSLAFALLLLPLAGAGSMRRRGARGGRFLLLALFGLVASGAMTGCGTGSGGFFGQAPTNYTITVTGTATSVANTTLQHSTTVTLTVQ